jgi:hypothetical protein
MPRRSKCLLNYIFFEVVFDLGDFVPGQSIEPINYAQSALNACKKNDDLP